MNSILRRRRAAMGARNVEQPLALVDGTYYDGEIIVTDGNHLTVSFSGRQWEYLRIPFNRPLQGANGDVFSITPTGTIPRGNMGLTRNDNTNLFPPSDYWPSGSANRVTETKDTEYVAFFVRNRQIGTYIGNFTISIKKNGDVVL